jgi:lipoprotein-releasing system permease protein
VIFWRHLRFELFIANRYLRARRRQAIVGLITALSMLGIMAGVAALIIALAITNGMRRDLQQRLLGATSHVELMRIQSDGIRNWRWLTDKLSSEPHVAAAAPALYGQVLISRGARAGGALVKGVLPQEESRVSDILSTVKLGSAKPLQSDSPDTSSPPILLGKDLADSLDASVGSVVMVTSPQGELTPLGVLPKYQRFQVAGIFQSGFYEYDSAWAFMRLADAQRLFGEPDIVSVIAFRLDDLNDAATVATQLEQDAGSGFMATTWMQQNRELFRALRLEQFVTFIVLALIVLVAALNILTSLTMMVMEKTKDIAVLMAMGVQQEQIRRIFVLQGFLVSVVGTAAGLILGYLLSWLGGHYHVHLNAEVYSLDTLPFAPRLRDGVLVAAVALAVSLLATLYPSRAAANIHPAEALRYE